MSRRFKPGEHVLLDTDDIPMPAVVVMVDGQADDPDLQAYILSVSGRLMSEPVRGMFLRSNTLEAVAFADEGPQDREIPITSNSIQRAARFARVAHGGQKRDVTGDPYIRHPARVASRVTMLDASLGDDLTATEEMIMAAWLHDVEEDTPTTAEQIRREFGPVVADYVSKLTNEYTTKRHPKTKRAQRKELELVRLREAPIEARAIKLLDRIDNLREMDPKSSFADVYVPESEDLAEAVGESLPVLKAELLAEITKLSERMGR